MKTMRLLCCFFLALSPLSTRMWPSVSGQNAKVQSVEMINVKEFLRECRELSVKKVEESRRQSGNYTYKSQKTWREQSRNGADEHSEVFEVYPAPFRKWRAGERFKLDSDVLIEKDGKSVSPERIEKERLKVGRDLEKFERASDPVTELMFKKPDSMAWLSFFVYKNVIAMPFANERIEFQGDEFFEKCEFGNPYRDNVGGRETIALRFHPRPEAVFAEMTKYFSNFEGIIWVDEADKFIFRLAAWPQGVNFESNDSDYLLENAAVAIDYIRVKEGLWFRRMGRMNALKYPRALLWLKYDFSLECFDYKLYKVDSEKEKLSAPEKK